MRRRDLIFGALGCTLIAGRQSGATPIMPSGSLRFASAGMDQLGSYFLSALTPQGLELFRSQLPGRGHAPLFRPQSNELIIFARRPGTFAQVVSADRGVLQKEIQADPARHFYGHGVFSNNGRDLYATENDYEAARGVISCYNAESGYEKVGEIRSYGSGPHDIKILADDKTLVVANGGIVTHPKTGRAKLNLATMRPSIAFIDRHTGALLHKAELPPKFHKLSLRHLALLPRDRIAVAMQYEGPKEDRFPLVAICQLGEPLSILPVPDPVLASMKNYCGSVVADRSGAYLAASCPKGGITVFWDLKDNTYMTSLALRDGCGLSGGSEPGDFIISSGEGTVLRFNAISGSQKELEVLHSGPVHWDNHLSLWVPG
ncbi:MAG: DUF1513 domain-containing protein [Pseudomonadota bacterium]